MIVLRLGSKGMEVTKLQLLLQEQLKPVTRIVPDGDFGQITDTHVRIFQRRWGLADDGVVGPKTWFALGQVPVRLERPPDPVDERASLGGTPKNWMDIAKAELGISEDSQAGKHNERILAYHRTTTLDADWASKDETPWCSSFVNWVMKEAGYTGTNNALAKSWRDWGRGLTVPEYGAVTVVRNTKAKDDPNTGSRTGFHVGFYVSGSTSMPIRLLGGNQSDQVKYSSFYGPTYEFIAARMPA